MKECTEAKMIHTNTVKIANWVKARLLEPSETIKWSKINFNGKKATVAGFNAKSGLVNFRDAFGGRFQYQVLDYVRLEAGVKKCFVVEKKTYKEDVMCAAEWMRFNDYPDMRKQLKSVLHDHQLVKKLFEHAGCEIRII